MAWRRSWNEIGWMRPASRRWRKFHVWLQKYSALCDYSFYKSFLSRTQVFLGTLRYFWAIAMYVCPGILRNSMPQALWGLPWSPLGCNMNIQSLDDLIKLHGRKMENSTKFLILFPCANEPLKLGPSYIPPKIDSFHWEWSRRKATNLPWLLHRLPSWGDLAATVDLQNGLAFGHLDLGSCQRPRVPRVRGRASRRVRGDLHVLLYAFALCWYQGKDMSRGGPSLRLQVTARVFLQKWSLGGCWPGRRSKTLWNCTHVWPSVTPKSSCLYQFQLVLPSLAC